MIRGTSAQQYLSTAIPVEWPKGQDLCPDELYYNSICPSSFIKSVKFNKSLQRRNISGTAPKMG